MKRALVSLAVCSLVAGASLAAAADEAPRTISADAVVVVSARPLAMLGLVARLGSGWEKLARRGLPIPAAVSPFDPSLLASLGLDPAATTWASARLLRGHLHVRAAIPLSDPRLAEAIVQSASHLANVELVRSPGGAWLGHKDQIAVVVRLEKNLLVLDALVRGVGVAPTSAELVRLAPIHPPRAFDATRGTAKRMGPSDAFAVWADLAGLATLGLFDADARLTDALRAVNPEMRAKIERTGRAEIATCRAALKAVPASFDDLLVAIVVHSPSTVDVEATLGTHGTAIEALRGAGKPVRATRALAPGDGDGDLRFSVVDAAPIRAALRPLAKPTVREDVPRECPNVSSIALGLRVWPALLAKLIAKSDAKPGKDGAWFRLLAGLRGLVVLIPPSVSQPGQGGSEGFNASSILALGEIDDAVRGDLDRTLNGNFGATTPLRVASRQLSAYSPPAFPWSTGEGPLVAVDPLPDTSGGALVGFGTRDHLKGAFERVVPAAANPIASADGSTLIAQLTTDVKLLLRVFSDFGDPRSRTFADGVSQIDAALSIDGKGLRFDLALALRPVEARP